MEEGLNLAKVRQARRCRARSKRTGLPCRAWAIVGGEVCRAHGGATFRVHVAAAQRREREAVERAMIRAEQRHAQELVVWAAELLGKPPEDVTADDLRHCAELHTPPPLRLDLRFVPRGPVVIRRRR
jgi:hypothetical protein